MHKVVSALALIILISSCSTVSRLNTVSDNASERSDILKLILNNNLSNNNFQIQKIELKVNLKGQEDKFLANLKYAQNGDLLISIRNFTGIEGLRILLRGDSIKINDRLNKRFYYGNAQYLIGNYGIRKEMITIILGDLFVNQANLTRTNCTDNLISIKSIYKNYELRYNASCNGKKIINADISDSRGAIKIVGSFGKFRSDGIFKFPGVGNFEMAPKGLSVSYKIKNIQAFDGVVSDMAEGKNYEKILLR